MTSQEWITHLIIVATTATIVGLAPPVSAQPSQGPLQGRPAEPARTPADEAIWAANESVWRGGSVGENYHLEIAGGLWNPTPAISASSEQFGIIGTTIDFGSDLGMVRQRHGEMRLTLKPGRRHKLRLHWLPMQYRQSAILQREIVFQGIKYNVGIPVDSSLTWNAWRFGYELDVIVRERGFLGLILEAKYTDVQAELNSPVAFEYARARAPIPAVGAIARVYISRFTPITAEFTAFQMPADVIADYSAHLVDYDIYGTVNLTNMFGISIGYRSMDMRYVLDRDVGDFQVKGVYFSGAFRF
jgi:hypothetical protein